MEVGIREARSNLSKLISAVQDGEEVFLTNRGERVIQLVLAPKAGKAKDRGFGCLRGKIHLNAGWDSPEADQEIVEMFEDLD